MNKSTNKIKKLLSFPLLCAIVVFLSIIFFILSSPSLFLTEDEKFENFTMELFKNELSGNTLNLHYSLAYPEKMNIHTKKVSLGRTSIDRTELYKQYQEYENALNSFSYSKLSLTNQITLDTLLLYFNTEQSISDCFLLEEYLSPSLGIQAQLPILLAEYTFRREQDIYDYLNLLQDIKPYFQSILDFEKVKSNAGFFMCDETVDRIQQQCQSFISDPDSNYMQDIFSDKINEFTSISPNKKTELISLHETLLNNEVIPAYKELIIGLEALYGTGHSAAGLCHFPNGTKYYQYLLQSKAGIYTSVPKLEYRLTQQLSKDTQAIAELIKENPELTSQYTQNESSHITEFSFSPEMMLESLIDIFQQDFPAPVSTDYELCYVHESMEKYLSPAFYITPPLDTGTPNTIYLNKFSLPSPLETFTTLAHEGYPGHLYQTTYFTSTDTLPIRHLFSCNGYVEGWATYIESYAYEYAAEILQINPVITKLAFLNKSATLCLYSLLDIGIHYHGWTESETASFLTNFGIIDENIVHEIFLYIVENPANYLQYYCGYLNFLDLKESSQEHLGNAFSLKSFHEKILQIGPVPFPLLEKYIK